MLQINTTVGDVDEDENWEEVVDFTKIKKGGVKIDEILSTCLSDF